MLEHLPQVARWVGQKWHKSPSLVRIGYVFAGVVLLTAAVALLPFSKQLGEFFTQLPDTAQGIAFFAMVVGLVAFVLFSYNRAVRVDELKTVNERLKLDLAQAQSDVESHDERLAHLMHVESRVNSGRRTAE